jgi:hypothetical protein
MTATEKADKACEQFFASVKALDISEKEKVALGLIFRDAILLTMHECNEEAHKSLKEAFKEIRA